MISRLETAKDYKDEDSPLLSKTIVNLGELLDLKRKKQEEKKAKIVLLQKRNNEVIRYSPLLVKDSV